MTDRSTKLRSSQSSRHMPLRTRLVVRLIERERGSISTMTGDEITRAREWVTPNRPPYSWVTGPLHPGVDITTSSFPARDGARVRVRTYVPRRVSGPLPVVLWFHGGGWVLGSVRGYDPLCSFLAATAEVAVVSVDYRLAPEHAAPRAVLDCLDAVRWVASAGQRLGWRPEGLGVAGDSAGGNLAAVVSQLVKEEGGATISHQSLVYPAVDATMSFPSVSEHANGAILTRHDMEVFLAHYLGAGPDALSARDPLVSPLYAAELAGLPPTLVQTAELDPLRDEGLAYAQALRAAGVPVRSTTYPRVPHGFMSFPGATRVGRAARAELSEWVREHARPKVVD